MVYIDRIQGQELSAFIHAESPSSNVLLIEGARQVGKTTLAMETLNHYQGSIIRINLEREKRLLSRIDDCIEFSDFATVLQDEVKFNSDISSVLFIDEAQESAVLGGFVRFMKEEWPKTRIILTGSTLTRLFRPNQRFPVGRFSRLLVTPFSFSEILKCVV